MSLPLLEALNYVYHFSILVKVMSANPLYSAIQMVAPRTMDLLAHMWGPTFLLCIWDLLLIVNQWLDMDFQSCKSNLKLIIALPKQHYNNLNHTGQLCPHIVPVPMETMLFGLGWVQPTKLCDKNTNDMAIHGTTMFLDNPFFLLLVWTFEIQWVGYVSFEDWDLKLIVKE